jgi:uncharacterized protein (TIGR02246 family)
MELWPRATRNRLVVAVTLAARAVTVTGFHEISIFFRTHTVTIKTASVANSPSARRRKGDLDHCSARGLYSHNRGCERK